MSTELTTQERIVLVYNPSFQNQQTHFTSRATTYGQLQEELLAQNIVENLSDWKVMEGRTRVTLEHPEAMLPTNIPLANKPGQVSNDIILIMTQKKMDLGASLSRKEMMQALKEYRIQSKENNARVKKVFGNYTQLSTKTLAKKYYRFAKNHFTPGSEEQVEPSKEVEQFIPEEELTPEETFAKVTQEECEGILSNWVEVKKNLDTIYERISRVSREAQRILNKEVALEQDLLDEFEGIKESFGRF